MQDSKNFILAIVLSILVLIGWQYFFASPQIDRARQQQAVEQQRADTQPGQTANGVPSAPNPTTAPPAGQPAASAVTGTRQQALAASPRVPVDTPSVTGSINLKGGRIDDLSLDDYHLTVDRQSPSIILLSPTGGPDAYFAEFGWIAQGQGQAVPGSDTLWTAPEGAKLTAASPVALTWNNGTGLTFTRTFTLDDKYMFSVADQVANTTGAPVTLFPYGRVARLGEPASSGTYILHEGPIGVIGSAGLKEESYSTIKKDKEHSYSSDGKGWLGITDKYWAAALVPDQAKPFQARFAYFDQPAPMFQADYRADAISVPAGGTGEAKSRLFAGAKQVAVVNAYRDQLGIERFDLLIDWGWFYFLTKPLFFVIDWFYRLFGNFGIAILAVTVLVKAIFFPLANKSYKSMSKMKVVQPQMMALRERYKDDKAQQQKALMELYKKEKINPIAGCWPVLLQIPVFFSLYKVLYVTIEMRHAPFFGWIQDLSSPDPTSVFNLFGLIPWAPPHFLLIGVWPLLMGVTMWVQMRLNPTPQDPAQQMIFNWMPVIFTFMLASFPAGLVIYWAWNNSLSIIQQYVIMRRQGVQVDLWGNIRSTFKRKPKAATGKAEVKS